MKALIYLFGFPGVGKQTLAHAIGEQAPFLALENHLLSNAFRQVLEHIPQQNYPQLEPLLKHHTMKAWLNLFEFISAAAPEQALVLTSVLYENDPDRLAFFEFVRGWAKERDYRFLPVRLVCEQDELERRLQTSWRQESYKLTDPDILADLQARFELLDPPDVFELDVTHLAPETAAMEILDRLSALPKI